jgi:sugar (pentulose or hexulose) kinase
LENVIDEKMTRTIIPIGDRAGSLIPQAASLTGLKPGIAVAIANVDAHVSVPAATVIESGRMVMIMGTSICHMVLTKEEPWTPLRDAREFSLVLNSAGRMDRPSLGIAVCMGDRGAALEEANRVLDDYRRSINKYLGWVMEKPERMKDGQNARWVISPL